MNHVQQPGDTQYRETARYQGDTQYQGETQNQDDAQQEVGAGSAAQGTPKGCKTLAAMPTSPKAKPASPKPASPKPASPKPASPRQIEANRRNAAKSTGPRSDEGKAAVRLNAVRHGLLSPQMLLPGEDEAALAELAGRLWEGLRPEGAVEELLVGRITAAAWRLRRLLEVEAQIFVPPSPDGGSAKPDRAGIAFHRTADTFSKLSRYEVTIENGLYRALQDLRLLQAARAAGAALLPPPLDAGVIVLTQAPSSDRTGDGAGNGTGDGTGNAP